MKNFLWIYEKEKITHERNFSWKKFAAEKDEKDFEMNTKTKSWIQGRVQEAVRVGGAEIKALHFTCEFWREGWF